MTITGVLAATRFEVAAPPLLLTVELDGHRSGLPVGFLLPSGISAYEPNTGRQVARWHRVERDQMYHSSTAGVPTTAPAAVYREMTRHALTALATAGHLDVAETERACRRALRIDWGAGCDPADLGYRCGCTPGVVIEHPLEIQGRPFVFWMGAPR